uniref:Zinc finger HIT domain-containing protein 2-like n=1 Tax=Saccoglossus kowalevskii TaxID=10224 RepID=A0ABM0M0I5_SACKO|nr:PREDICTED: zinc finger HIT domain-containing protein 2-like [Saccoglossus kowalevskii]
MANENNVCVSKTLEEDQTKGTVCKLCLKQFSRYTCPRCNIPYCSVSCYKSEVFLFTNLYTVLKVTFNIIGSRIIAIQGLNLKLIHHAQNNFIKNVLFLHSKSKEEDKDTDALWERLTEVEKKEFETLIKDGGVEGIVDVWTPWWNAQDKHLIEELKLENNADSLQNDASTSEHEIPNIVDKIPKLTDLLKSQKPADSVQFNLLEVLFIYAYVIRLYNGSHFDLPVQTMQDILQVSDVLSKNKNYSSTEEAVHNAMIRINQDKSLQCTQTFTTSVLLDVIKILCGRSKKDPLVYILSALSDLYALLSMAKRKTGKDGSDKPTPGTGHAKSMGPSLQKTLLFRSKKKVMFFLSWCVSYREILKPLALELHMEYISLKTEQEEQLHTQQKIESHWGGKQPPKKCNNLIQEII